MATRKATILLDDASQQFGIALPENTIVLNLDNNTMYELTASTTATQTLQNLIDAWDTDIIWGGAVSSVFGRTGVVTAQSGDYTKAQVWLGNVDNTSDADQTTLWTVTTGNVDAIVSSSSVWLWSVNNTSDADKPVSTAQQTALDTKANLAWDTFTGKVNINSSSDEWLEINSNTATWQAFRVNASSITTGQWFLLDSNSATSTGNLFWVRNDNPSSTAVAQRIQNDWTWNGLLIDQNGNGRSLSIDSEATNQNVIRVDAANTSGDIISINSAWNHSWTVLLVNQDNASSSWFATRIRNDWTWNTIYVDNNNTWVWLRLDAWTNDTATSATAGSQTLPANPEWFIVFSLNGTNKKIPYYAN